MFAKGDRVIFTDNNQWASKRLAGEVEVGGNSYCAVKFDGLTHSQWVETKNLEQDIQVGDWVEIIRSEAPQRGKSGPVTRITPAGYYGVRIDGSVSEWSRPSIKKTMSRVQVGDWVQVSGYSSIYDGTAGQIEYMNNHMATLAIRANERLAFPLSYLTKIEPPKEPEMKAPPDKSPTFSSVKTENGEFPRLIFDSQGRVHYKLIQHLLETDKFSRGLSSTEQATIKNLLDRGLNWDQIKVCRCYLQSEDKVSLAREPHKIFWGEVFLVWSHAAGTENFYASLIPTNESKFYKNSPALWIYPEATLYKLKWQPLLKGGALPLCEFGDNCYVKPECMNAIRRLVKFRDTTQQDAVRHNNFFYNRKKGGLGEKVGEVKVWVEHWNAFTITDNKKVWGECEMVIAKDVSCGLVYYLAPTKESTVIPLSVVSSGTLEER